MEFSFWKYWVSSTCKSKPCAYRQWSMSAQLVLVAILSYLDCKIICANNLSALYSLSNMLPVLRAMIVL